MLYLWPGEDMEMENVECGEDGCQTDGPENRECFPIFVPPNDPVYGGRKHCLMFVRSQEVTNEKCVPGFTHRLVVFTARRVCTAHA